jgi:SAM-dependent methyltransferase
LSASSTASVIHSSWENAARLVADSRDLLDARPGAGGGEPPAALTRRGWASFLLSLEPHELEAIETRGPDADWPDRTPAALRDLVERARLACALPVLHDASTSAPAASPRPGETPRKRAQIDAFARLVAPLASSSRVLDVGSGHGHLTRDLAVRLGLPVVGLERDPVLADRARALSLDGKAVFTVTDVLRDGLALSPGDCVVGLHACGELGEVIVRSVAQARAAAVVLVSCCLQKRRQLSRAPLGVPAGVEPAALELPRSLLGLSNLAARDEGVEASRADNLAARARRLALNRLLSEGGEPVRLGAEIDGLNRRTAHRDLPTLVARAFALRHRPVPSPTAIAEAAAWAQVEHARARRLSVPRALLSRVLEVYVLLDRAAFLERHGLHVEVGELFPAAVSPRNLALVARVSGSVIFATPD